MRALVVVALALPLSACLDVQECTEIGCSPFGLSIQVVDSSQLAIDAFDATITIDGTDYACGGGTAGTLQCFGNSIGVSGAPATVHAVITEKNGGRRFEGDITPEYTTSRPNGPLCDPECTQATFKAVLR